jgi:hypothetical protein
VINGGTEETTRVNAALQVWRQGDVTLDSGLFLVHLADKNLPLTREAREAIEQAPVEDNPFEVPSPAIGLVVVTQTCDIIKDCTKFEFVDVSPLVHVNDQRLQEIRKGRQIRYAYIPGVASERLVADLERTMAVEKSVVAGWTRTPGCSTDDEVVAFAAALARKRQRFAFPDGFNAGLAAFKDRLRGKRKSTSTVEGLLVKALDCVRAFADPNWNASHVTVFFWFLLLPKQDIDFGEARLVIEEWMKLISLPAPFALADPCYSLVEQQDMTAQEYLASQPLDYDDLSM